MKYNSIKSVGEEKKTKKHKRTHKLLTQLWASFLSFPASIMVQGRTICPTFSSKNHILTTKALFTSARRRDRSSCFSKADWNAKAWPSRTVKTTFFVATSTLDFDSLSSSETCSAMHILHEVLLNVYALCGSVWPCFKLSFSCVCDNHWL